jgi:hypothetical protein
MFSHSVAHISNFVHLVLNFGPVLCNALLQNSTYFAVVINFCFIPLGLTGSIQFQRLFIVYEPHLC